MSACYLKAVRRRQAARDACAPCRARHPRTEMAVTERAEAARGITGASSRNRVGNSCGLEARRCPPCRQLAMPLRKPAESFTAAGNGLRENELVAVVRSSKAATTDFRSPGTPRVLGKFATGSSVRISLKNGALRACPSTTLPTRFREEPAYNQAIASS